MTDRRLLSLTALGLLAVATGLGVRLQDRDAPDPWVTTTVEGIQAEHYESLEAMARAADAIVVGRLRSVEPGRVFGKRDETLPHPRDPQTFYATVKIDVSEVLTGSLEPGWTLEVMVPNLERIDDLGSLTTEGRAIFFLRSKEREARALGIDRRRIRAEEGYYRLVTMEAVINDEAGDAVPAMAGEAAFAGLDRASFDSVISEVRALVNGP